MTTRNNTLTLDWDMGPAIFGVQCTFPDCLVFLDGEHKVTSKCACDYAFGYAPPNYPMPAIRSKYGSWLERASYSVALWSHSEVDTDNAIRYHAMMDIACWGSK